MLKTRLTTLLIILAALGTGIGVSYTVLRSTTLLWNGGALWALPGAIVAGLLFGALRGAMKKKAVIRDAEIVRHGIGSVISHWGTVFGIFILMSSGILIGFLNVPPFAPTLATLIPALNLHFFGLVSILFCGSFFLADYSVSWDWSRLVPTFHDIVDGFFGKVFFHRPWNKEGKYLSSQKAAFVPAAIAGTVMLVTGAIKVSAHIWHIQAAVWGWATVLHDVFFLAMVLYVIVHVGVVVFGHWSAFLSYFTGEISTDLAERDYPMWYDQVKSGTDRK